MLQVDSNPGSGDQSSWLEMWEVLLEWKEKPSTETAAGSQQLCTSARTFGLPLQHEVTFAKHTTC